MSSGKSGFPDDRSRRSPDTHSCADRRNSATLCTHWRSSDRSRSCPQDETRTGRRPVPRTEGSLAGSRMRGRPPPRAAGPRPPRARRPPPGPPQALPWPAPGLSIFPDARSLGEGGSLDLRARPRLGSLRLGVDEDVPSHRLPIGARVQATHPIGPYGFGHQIQRF